MERSRTGSGTVTARELDRSPAFRRQRRQVGQIGCAGEADQLRADATPIRCRAVLRCAHARTLNQLPVDRRQRRQIRHWERLFELRDLRRDAGEVSVGAIAFARPAASRQA